MTGGFSVRAKVLNLLPSCHFNRRHACGQSGNQERGKKLKKQNAGRIVDIGPRTLIVDGRLGRARFRAKVGGVTLEVVDASDKHIEIMRKHDIRLVLPGEGD